MPTEPDLTDVWKEVQTQLPDGWILDGLRCASTGIRPEDRSDDWVAYATSPNGTSVTHRAATAVEALRGLPDKLG